MTIQILVIYIEDQLFMGFLCMLVYTGCIESLSLKILPEKLKNTEPLKSVNFSHAFSISWFFLVAFPTFSDFKKKTLKMWKFWNNLQCSCSHLSILLLSLAQAGSDPMEYHECSFFLPWRSSKMTALSLKVYGVAGKVHAKNGCHHSHLLHVIFGENRSKSCFSSHISLLVPLFLPQELPANPSVSDNWKSERRECWFHELMRNQFSLGTSWNHLFLRYQKWSFPTSDKSWHR